MLGGGSGPEMSSSLSPAVFIASTGSAQSNPYMYHRYTADIAHLDKHMHNQYMLHNIRQHFQSICLPQGQNKTWNKQARKTLLVASTNCRLAQTSLDVTHRGSAAIRSNIQAKSPLPVHIYFIIKVMNKLVKTTLHMLVVILRVLVPAVCQTKCLPRLHRSDMDLQIIVQ